MTLLGDKKDFHTVTDTLPGARFPEWRHREILAEGVFRRILRWEQHRAQRSPKCFLLVLLDIRAATRTKRREIVLREIFSVLSVNLREADIAGWYRKDAMIGIIFSDVHATNKNLVQNLMNTKLNAPLLAKLGPEIAAQIYYSFHFFPEDWDKLDSGNSAEPTQVKPLTEVGKLAVTAHSVKRTIDVVGSLIGFIIFSPFFIVIPIAIKLTSKGPVFFKQERVGQYGLRFSFLKFRSMENGNDPSIHRDFVKQFIAGATGALQTGDLASPTYKIQHDSRVTRVGKFLRKTSLDELPQLINVLKGEMSLVGPRPPIPYEVESYQHWHLRRLLEAKPGITGLWQVKGRSKTTFDDMVRLDLRYARSWSLWLDLRILLLTPRAVFSGGGAY